VVEYNVSGGVVFAGTRILMPVAVATVLSSALEPVSGTIVVGVTGTIGTIASPSGVIATVATVQSQVQVVGTVVPGAGSYSFTTVSATIKGGPGTLYAVAAAGNNAIASLSAGTLLVLDSTSTIMVAVVASGAFVSHQFGAVGVGFGTLIASIIGGAIDTSFVVR